MDIKIENSSISIEELPIQEYNNISIIPLKSNSSTKVDILSLKKGLELGLVEVKECEPSTVNTIMVTNNAVTPLILVDGDEITGAKQNRIVNTTILIPPKTTMAVSVSCTEHGRWHFKGHTKNETIFCSSNYFANSDTRRVKAQNSYNDMDCQAAVWDSISEVESRMDFKSATSALNDSYENIIKDQEECLEHFKVLEGQTGLIAIIDGEIRGVELFANHSMYKDYHEKIIKSYVIDSLNTENIKNNLSDEEISKIVNDISNSNIKKDKTNGLGESLKFSNDYGNGSALIYDGEIIHMPYFKNADNPISRDFYPDPIVDVNYVNIEDIGDIENTDESGLNHDDLKEIEKRFHELIFHRAPFAREYENFELPKITPELMNAQDSWFPVPGMYGGFKYNLSIENGEYVLITESWCRVAEGSGQAHRITKDNCELIREGFV